MEASSKVSRNFLVKAENFSHPIEQSNSISLNIKSSQSTPFTFHSSPKPQNVPGNPFCLHQYIRVHPRWQNIRPLSSLHPKLICSQLSSKEIFHGSAKKHAKSWFNCGDDSGCQHADMRMWVMVLCFLQSRWRNLKSWSGRLFPITFIFIACFDTIQVKDPQSLCQQAADRASEWNSAECANMAMRVNSKHKWDINFWMKSSCHHHTRVVCK